VLLLINLLGSGRGSADWTGDASTPENAVRPYFHALSNHDWFEAWNYLQQHHDEPQSIWPALIASGQHWPKRIPGLQ